METKALTEPANLQAGGLSLSISILVQALFPCPAASQPLLSPLFRKQPSAHQRQPSPLASPRPCPVLSPRQPIPSPLHRPSPSGSVANTTATTRPHPRAGTSMDAPFLPSWHRGLKRECAGIRERE